MESKSELYSQPKQYRVRWNQSRDFFSKALLGEARQWSNVIRNAKPWYYLEGLFLSFSSSFPHFFSSLSAVLGHSGELKNVTTMLKECIMENLIRCTKARLSMEGHWELEWRRKEGRITFAVVLTFFLFIFTII